MSLRLPDDWVWDAWYAVDGDLVHAFFLHAPRRLGDPRKRHFEARVGHAVSRDLVRWEPRREALGRGRRGAFDDLATWTGSVTRQGDGWLMAYSGVSTRDDGQVQRIGFARSHDLDQWERTGTVVEADPRWYEVDRAVGEVHWRDPWLWTAPDGVLHLLLTARARVGELDGRGVIGHAWSTDDGASFDAGPPLSAPGDLRQIEVPQLVRMTDDRWLVLGSARPVDASAARLARGVAAESGTFVLEGPAPLGPFRLCDGPFLHGSPTERAYAGRLVELRGRRWLMTWTDTVDGAFVGELADPIALERDATGGLRVADAARA